MLLTDISTIRREYSKSSLNHKDLTTDPIDLFKKWFKQACEANLPDPTAMNVGTVDKFGQSYQRLVLLKHFDSNGLVFYTNLRSRKAIHLKYNPRISLHFSWNAIEKQILIVGVAKQLSTLDVIKYFYTRPRDSQISSWVSNCHKKISSRNLILNRFLQLRNKFSEIKNIPLPKFWGGYRVAINSIEFWQGRRYRLHDRFLYQRKKNGWRIDRLLP